MRGATPSLPYTFLWSSAKLSVEILPYEFPTFIFHSHSRIQSYITNTLEMLSTKPNKSKSMYTLNEQ
jgi:hypothetical protein